MTTIRTAKQWPPAVRHRDDPEPMTVAAVLEVEKAFPALVDDGRKTVTVRARFGVSMTRYVQRLNALLDDPAFVEADPVMARLLRQRQVRHLRTRSVRRVLQSSRH